MSRTTTPPYEPLSEETKIVPAQLSWITVALGRMGLTDVKPREYLVTNRSIVITADRLGTLLEHLIQAANVAPPNARIRMYLGVDGNECTVSWTEKVLNNDVGSNSTR